MRKAVFLDRDGVINSDEGHYYVFRPNDFVLNDGLAGNIKRLYDAGYIIIIISNQGGIGKGLYTIADSDKLHEIFIKEMNEVGVNIAEVYFCPHHPDSSNCLCRKPNALMIEKALARFDIDASRSFLIGDSPRDVEAAQKAGVKGILVPKNTNIESAINQILTSK